LLNYRLGRFVFISTDCICRDAGSLFGKIKKEKFFIECMTILAEYLNEIKPDFSKIYFDAPVSMSKVHKKHLEAFLEQSNVKSSVQLVVSADTAIIDSPDGTIATSDSAIIDHCSKPVLDIPRSVIEQKYKTELYNLKDILIRITS
jgi:hypothetical protein